MAWDVWQWNLVENLRVAARLQYGPHIINFCLLPGREIIFCINRASL